MFKSKIKKANTGCKHISGWASGRESTVSVASSCPRRAADYRILLEVRCCNQAMSGLFGAAV